jgi:hypothetical protein
VSGYTTAMSADSTQRSCLRSTSPSPSISHQAMPPLSVIPNANGRTLKRSYTAVAVSTPPSPESNDSIEYSRNPGKEVQALCERGFDAGFSSKRKTASSYKDAVSSRPKDVREPHTFVHVCLRYGFNHDRESEFELSPEAIWNLPPWPATTTATRK